MPGLSPNTVYALAALACAAAGAASELRRRHISNRIIGPGLVAGLLLHLALGGWRSLLSAALAGVLGGGVCLLFSLAGAMGPGDVKLMAAVCCLAGLPAVAQVLVGAALAAGLAAVFVAAFRRTKSMPADIGRRLAPHGSAARRWHPELNLDHSGVLRLPLGLAIAGAASSACNLLVR